jgi:hypothetical protein
LVDPGLTSSLGVVGGLVLNCTSYVGDTLVVPLVGLGVLGVGHGGDWDTTLLVCGSSVSLVSGGEVNTGGELPSVNPLLVDDINGVWKLLSGGCVADDEGWGLGLGSEGPCALLV